MFLPFPDRPDPSLGECRAAAAKAVLPVAATVDPG
jgi:hypothetical protein